MEFYLQSPTFIQGLYMDFTTHFPCSLSTQRLYPNSQNTEVDINIYTYIQHVIYIDGKVIRPTVQLLLTHASYFSGQRSIGVTIFPGQSSRFHKVKNYTIRSSKCYAMPTGKWLPSF